MADVTDEVVLAGLRRDGYVLIAPVFQSAEVAEIRGLVQDAAMQLASRNLMTTEDSDMGRVQISRCDLLSIPQLRGVLLDRRIVGLAGSLLGGRPVYFGDSSFRIGNTRSGWHKDSANLERRRASGSDQDYRLIRMGLYLQDHTSHSGGLSVRPRSHTANREPHRGVLIDSSAGDMVAWDLRTSHSGDSVRLRGLRRVGLPLRVQRALPRHLRVPEEKDRMALFMTFGAPGLDLDHYIEYLSTRDYAVDMWSHSEFSADVLSQAEASGVTVLKPIPQYGPELTGG